MNPCVLPSNKSRNYRHTVTLSPSTKIIKCLKRILTCFYLTSICTLNKYTYICCTELQTATLVPRLICLGWTHKLSKWTAISSALAFTSDLPASRPSRDVLHEVPMDSTTPHFMVQGQSRTLPQVTASDIGGTSILSPSVTLQQLRVDASCFGLCKGIRWMWIVSVSAWKYTRQPCIFKS